MEASVLAGLIGTVVAVVTSIASLAYWLGRKFARIDMRLKQLEGEFGARLQRLEERFDMRLKQLEREFGARLQQLEGRVDSLAGFTRSTYALLVDFMTMKGLFAEEERAFLIREVERLSASLPLRQNPLTREEVKLILEAVREVKEKDPREVDVEKLDRALEIAWSWFEREGRYEAARLWMVLYALRAIVRRERGEY